MSIRDLGDWSPLDLDSDPVYADPDLVAAAQKRYANIATTVDDAVARLQKVMDDNSDGLVGQYIEGLRSDAASLHDRLAKAGVRYHDVADQIKIYQPGLQHGLDESAGALRDATEAVAAQGKAEAMPDPQKSPDGSTSPEEQRKGTAKTDARNQAEDALTAAKNRLTSALDQLNVAGKRLGDAVNCDNYDDGLTDSTEDKLDAILKWISDKLSIIGMILAGLALLFPGVDLLVLAGVAAGAASLVVDSILYHDGQGSLLDVIFGAVGLGLAGIGVGLAQLAKGLANDAKALANLGERPGAPQIGFTDDAFGEDFGAIELRPVGGGPGGAPAPAPGGWTNTTGGYAGWSTTSSPATDWTHLSDWYNNPLINGALSWLGGKLGGLPGSLGTWGGKLGATPEVGFWGSIGPQFGGAWKMWKGLGGDPLGFLAEWSGVLGGWSGFRGLAQIMGAVGGKISPLWYVWGGFNGLFGLGYGLGYTGGRLGQQIPDVNP